MSAYVMFIGRQRSFWTDWFNPRGFRHCFPFWFDPAVDRWIIPEIETHRVNIIVLTPYEFDQWLLIMQRSGGTVLQVQRQPSPRFFLRLGLWCVPFTAHAVGSGSRAFRPIGLWRDLIRDGAVPAFAREPKESPANDEITKGRTGKPRGKSQA